MQLVCAARHAASRCDAGAQQQNAAFLPYSQLKNAANVLLPKYPGAVFSEGQKVSFGLWQHPKWYQPLCQHFPQRRAALQKWQHSMLWRKGWPEEIRQQQ